MIWYDSPVRAELRLENCRGRNRWHVNVLGEDGERYIVEARDHMHTMYGHFGPREEFKALKSAVTLLEEPATVTSSPEFVARMNEMLQQLRKRKTMRPDDRSNAK